MRIQNKFSEKTDNIADKQQEKELVNNDDLVLTERFKSEKSSEEFFIKDDFSIEITNQTEILTVYSIEEVDQLEEDYQDATKDQKIRVNNLVKKIREDTPDKRLATIPKNWRSDCDTLICDFPNFSEVILFIRNQLALSAISNQVLRIPPFLLAGDAGIGKTEFMLTLANLFNTKLSVIDIANSQTGSALTGSENFWSNTKPGGVFNTLVFGDIANPIIMLDEIDKARIDSSYQPLSALHSLLEPRQACEFQDLSVPEMKVNASQVIWIATANKLELIEKSIIDRFTIFHIETPSLNQMKNIVKNQYQKFIENHPAGSYFESAISVEVASELCLYHPRCVRKMLEMAFGLAANEQRNHLILQDISDSKITHKEDKGLGIGFMSTV